MTEATRNPAGLPALVTRAFESIGLFNKGTAAVATGQAGAEESPAASSPVTAPVLNITRVAGSAAFIASAGSAALTLFSVEKGKDSAAIVAAAYGSTGLIVAAALVAAAVIFSADIRARSSAQAITAPTKTPAVARDVASIEDFKSAWSSAVSALGAVGDALPSRGTRIEYARLWMNAQGSVGFTDRVESPVELRDEHAKLSAGQRRIGDLLKEMTDDRENENDLGEEIRAIVAEMRSTLAGVA